MAGKPGRSKAGLESVIQWLTEGAPTVDQPQDVWQELCERLAGSGVPLFRSAVFVTTLHPTVMGRAFIWRPGEKVTPSEAPFSVMDSEVCRRNPFPRVIRTRSPIRRVIADPDCPEDFMIIAELRAEGVTDYLAQPLVFTTGEVHVASWTTRRKGGFSGAHLAALEAVRAPLARVAEIYALRRTARNLLDTYLGKHSGERVLKGLIRRGDGETIHAVIWFCDLRESTPLADSMPRADFLALLNAFLECMAGAVLDHGGEVLRFIGDAMLSIFPISEGETDPEGTARSACAAAVAAAKDAIGRVQTLNRMRGDRGEPPIGFGIGLHLGDVMYGNIGAPERLEFTVIGAAANEAARLEGLCKTLGRPLLLSGAVVGHLPGEWRSLGRHRLRGVGADHEVFTLSD